MSKSSELLFIRHHAAWRAHTWRRPLSIWSGRGSGPEQKAMISCEQGQTCNIYTSNRIHRASPSATSRVLVAHLDIDAFLAATWKQIFLLLCERHGVETKSPCSLQIKLVLMSRGERDTLQVTQRSSTTRVLSTKKVSGGSKPCETPRNNHYEQQNFQRRTGLHLSLQ